MTIFTSAISSAEQNLPRSQKGRKLTPEKNASKLDLLASTEADGTRTTSEERAAKKEVLQSKPYSIQPVTLSSCPFETVHLVNNIVIQLNVNHPFYKTILESLCGESDGESDFKNWNEDVKTAILLLLFSYAEAESMFDNNDILFSSLRFQWGTALAAALEEYQRGEGGV